MDRRNFITGVAGLAGLAGLTPGARAATPYSGQTLRFVVPYAAGGVADITARVCLDGIATALGAAGVVIENRPGAGGNIGAEQVARGAVDSHTFLVGPSSLFTTNPFVNELRLKTLDLPKAMVPVAGMADTLLTLVVPSTLGVSTVAQFVDKAKAEPLRIGNPGTGTPHHLAALLLERAIGARFVHVAYKGGAPMVSDASGGHLDGAVASVPVGAPMVSAGRLKWVGIMQPGPAPALPGVPSLAPVLGGATIPSWTGVFALAGTPPAQLDALNAAIAEHVRSAAVTTKLRDNGLEPLTWARPQMAAKLAQEADFMKDFLSRVKLDFTG